MTAAVRRGDDARSGPGAVDARVIQVRGVVEGVGFRPFVSRLATRYQLGGWVLSRRGVVEIVAEGKALDIERFCRGVRAEAPHSAQVQDVTCWPREPAGLVNFEIEPSDVDDEPVRVISPDVALCDACLAELFDPTDRRHRYPFLSCRECGPRLTVMTSLPYARDRTTMRSFPMCDRCAAEWEDPASRRYHDESVSCPTCGPTVELRDARWDPIHGDPIDQGARLVGSGSILAVKSIGGFRLACDATNDDAVRELRRRTARLGEPLSVMAPTIEAAARAFELRRPERALLATWRAPTVLVRQRQALAPSVALDARRIGAMLPAAPIEHLLLRAADRPLVVTDGRGTGDPACITNEEARRTLSAVADAFLLHDRDIVTPAADSVVRLRGERPVVIRRARGYAPSPIALPQDVAPVLGTGARLDAAFCLGSQRQAFLSPYLGRLESERAMARYRTVLDRAEKLLGIEPQTVGHDLDPHLVTSRFAARLGISAVAVQHHHAHIAAVMAEHGLEGRVIGVAFDGGGVGDDGTDWGGEFLLAGYGSATRAAHLRPVARPGGEAAVRNPVRRALSHLVDAGVLRAGLGVLGRRASDVRAVLQQIESSDAPVTSSAGRLFDAVAALTGVARLANYDVEPALLLEETADPSATFEYPFDVGLDGSGLTIDTRPVLKAVVRDLAKGKSPGDVAGRFHRTMAAGILATCRLLRGQSGLTRVCLAGSLFQNDLLTTDVAARLSSCDFDVYVPAEVPPGDGGIALGQVMVAHARTDGEATSTVEA
jgi:hydrogenase maturation protein HypF